MATCANDPLRNLYECLKICKNDYAQKANKNEQFLQRFGCTLSEIPQETFSFLADNVHENVWEHMNILPVYITVTSRDLLGTHENVFEEQLKTVDRKVKELQRKEADVQRKLEYNKKIQEIENKLSVPQTVVCNTKKAMYKKELLSKTLDVQDMPNLAQLFTELKEMNKKLNTLKEDTGIAKAKLSKYGQLPPNVHEATIVINEAGARYKNDADKMKNILEENPTNLPVDM